MIPAAIADDYAPGLERVFERVPSERSSQVDVDGTLPSFLAGTLFMNGPARFARGGFRYRHWLDGDGMVCALRFDDDVTLTTRYVASQKHIVEETARKPVFRGFGTTFPEDRLCRGIGLESAVNVSVVSWCGRLLAFGEQGLPWELDPVTLETRSRFDAHGALNEITPFSAHAKTDARSGELFNFGVSFSAARPLLNVFRFDARGGLVYRRQLPLPYPCSIHDCSLGARHLLFHISPYVVDVARMIDAGASLLDSLSWQPERGSRIWVVDRQDGRLLREIGLSRGYVLHHAACVDSDDRIELDVVELDEPVYAQYFIGHLFEAVQPGRAVRFSFDLDRCTDLARIETEYASAPDFPTTDASAPGAPYERLWMLGLSHVGHRGRKFFDELVQLDWRFPATARIFRLPPGFYFAGEPVFIPDPANADGGGVVCPVLDVDRDRTVFNVFDACEIETGPVARVIVAPALHSLFHGVFAADAHGHA